MAQIFYWTTKGTAAARPIYGVHPDTPFLDPLPADVAVFTVAEGPTTIAWPVPTGATRGRQHWTVVDTTTSPFTLRLASEATFFRGVRVASAAEVETLVTARALTELGFSVTTPLRLFSVVMDALWAMDTLLIRGDATLAEKAQATEIVTSLRVKRAALVALRNDAETLKSAKGWTVP